MFILIRNWQAVFLSDYLLHSNNHCLYDSTCPTPLTSFEMVRIFTIELLVLRCLCWCLIPHWQMLKSIVFCAHLPSPYLLLKLFPIFFGLFILLLLNFVVIIIYIHIYLYFIYFQCTLYQVGILQVLSSHL
jgi:hypothetical protein